MVGPKSRLAATSELCAREVPLLYGPVLVASHDELDAPAGLSREQWRMLGGGPKVTWSDKWMLPCRVARQNADRARPILNWPPGVIGIEGDPPALAWKHARTEARRLLPKEI